MYSYIYHRFHSLYHVMILIQPFYLDSLLKKCRYLSETKNPVNFSNLFKFHPEQIFSSIVLSFLITLFIFSQQQTVFNDRNGVAIPNQNIWINSTFNELVLTVIEHCYPISQDAYQRATGVLNQKSSKEIVAQSKCTTFYDFNQKKHQIF